ncbi:MAG: hypothetical protein A2381_03965 [Bdellovibrionales bacterium RIFOXYB1_FULL_37_110]|nr:MAG: hypothetical protein A2417_10075 [Bdellovibrionales bacterium RIFOXYC1_FULL_37_79]OFZ59080.1 MAG: hypothetical protein A2381_03965 [Bdellovibrionales bacterium RIFOXYB1_FULL_37_110]OFZ64087.1 MAG: hypothetical protein A2577_15085 [Bdellovibrionales bacterium RIFOXYD1_FULL_36_51]
MKTSLLVLFLLFSSSLFAFDLETARSQNKVCEEPTGYLKTLDPAIQADVDDINAKRKQKYQEVATAAKPQQELSVAAALMGKKLVDKYGACK